MNIDQFVDCVNDKTVNHQEREAMLISAARKWCHEIEQKEAEIKRLRGKVTKLKVKLGAGKSKTAALRKLQLLRKQKLQQLELSHNLEDQVEESVSGADSNHSFSITNSPMSPILPQSPMSPASPLSSVKGDTNLQSDKAMDDGELSPVRIQGSRRHSRLSTPRRLYRDKRSRRLSLSDDDGQGLKDGAGDSGDENIYRTERTDSNFLVESSNTLNLIDGYDVSVQYEDENTALHSTVQVKASSTLGLKNSMTSMKGRRKRTETQPMTANEISRATKMSPEFKPSTNNGAYNSSNDEDEEVHQHDSGKRQHSRIQSSMQLSSPSRETRERDSVDSSNFSVLSDLSEERRSGKMVLKSNTSTSTKMTSNSPIMSSNNIPKAATSNKRTTISSTSSSLSHTPSNIPSQPFSPSIDNSQTLFTCVWGSGRLPGLPDGERSPATMVSLDYNIFRGKRIVQVACGMGSRQAMYLTAGGDVYRSHNTFGENTEGVHDASTERSKYATALSNSPISKLIENGGTVGIDRMGEKSVESEEEEEIDGEKRKLKEIEKKERFTIKVREPILVQDFAWERALRSFTIVSVACGAQHCCALADGGQIFTWGRASDGRLGLAKHYKDSHDRTEVRTPKLVLPLLGIRIVDVQCGSSHTIAREASAVENLGDGKIRCVGGRLFSWGKGEFGQLGHGDTRTQPLPKEIKKGSLSNKGNSNGTTTGIVSVGCGWSFSVAIHYDGGISCWGRGREGQLGTLGSSGGGSGRNGTGDIFRPTNMNDSSFGRMDEDGMVPWCPHTVGCGHSHAIVLCQRHPGSVMMAHGLTAADMSRPTAVFSWGYGERGELGTQHPLRPIPAQISFPKLRAGDTVVSITTGSLHCAAVTQFGSVYVWGCNRHGALGVRNMNDLWVPESIPIRSLMNKVNHSVKPSSLVADGTVVYPIQVACGERCTIILLDKKASGRGQKVIGDNASSSSSSNLSSRSICSSSSSSNSGSYRSSHLFSLPIPSSRPYEMKSSISRYCLNSSRRSSFVVGNGTRGLSLNEHQFGDFVENGETSPIGSGSGSGSNGRGAGREGSIYDTDQKRESIMSDLSHSESNSSTRAQALLSDLSRSSSLINNGDRSNMRGSDGVRLGGGVMGDGGRGSIGSRGSTGSVGEQIKNLTGRQDRRSSTIISITDAKMIRDRIKNLRRDSKIWQEDILPKWELTHETPSRKLLRQQCARMSTGGVPPHLRKRVWPLLIANALRITPELFQMYRTRSKSKIWKRMEEESDYQTSQQSKFNTTSSPQRRVSRSVTSIGKEISLNLIDVDLPRTFPQLKLFDSTGPFHAKLKEVLETYACYRPDLGYVQGMSYIAALLCLYMADTYQAFICLSNVMIDDNSHFFAFFNLSRTLSNEKNRPEAYYNIFMTALSDHSKSLYKKMISLQKNGLEPSVYLFNWLQTAYLRILPLNITSRIWDLFLIDGTSFLFRVGIAVLVVFKSYLLKSEFEDCAKLLTNHPSKQPLWKEMVTEFTLFKQIDTVSLSRSVKETLARLISGSTR